MTKNAIRKDDKEAGKEFQNKCRKTSTKKRATKKGLKK